MDDTARLNKHPRFHGSAMRTSIKDEDDGADRPIPYSASGSFSVVEGNVDGILNNNDPEVDQFFSDIEADNNNVHNAFPQNNSMSSTNMSSPTEGEYDDDDDDNDDEDDDEECLESSPPSARDSTADIESIDAEIAQKLSNLSIQERDQVLYDIHGVADAVQETPELVEKSLSEFEVWLQKSTNGVIGRRKKRLINAYLLAESQSPEYVQRKPFRLLFLRAYKFKAKEACNCFLRHFDLKLDLFNESLLTKDLTLKDLSSEEIKCLSNGITQLLPVCDSAGRYVFCSINVLHENMDHRARVIFYTNMATMEMGSKEALNKGFVSVSYNVVNKSNSMNNSIAKRIAQGSMLKRLYAALPFRVCTVHFCSSTGGSMNSSKAQSSEGLSIADYVRRNFMEHALQVRTRSHRGTQQECLQGIGGFGIPIDSFPLASDGSIKRHRHRAWIESRKAIEARREKQQQLHCKIPLPDIYDKDGEDNNPEGGIRRLAPLQADVLLGRGGRSQAHIGNMRLRLMIESNLMRHETERKHGGKLIVAMEIVNQVKASGGLFLKFHDGMWWISVSDEEAYQKVAHDFRTLRKSKSNTLTSKSKNNKNKNGDSSGDDSPAQMANPIDKQGAKRHRPDSHVF